MSLKCYSAGPWFNPEQDEREKKVVNKLKALGFEVFRPREEVCLNPTAPKEEQEAAFRADIYGITNADFVFAVTNGKDMGTLFECGFAFANNIPIVYFAEGLTGGFNLMLARSAVKVYTNIDDVTYEEIEALVTGSKVDEYEGEVE